MKPLQHKHLIVRAEVLNPLNSAEKAKDWLIRLIEAIDMKLLTCMPSENPTAGYCDIPGNKGLTAVALIETSNITLHIWDECTPSLVELDVYTCGCLDPNIVYSFVNEMNCVEIKSLFLDREKGLEIINIEEIKTFK